MPIDENVSKRADEGEEDQTFRGAHLGGFVEQ